jgi:Family of unknown function (DUF5819)
VAKRKKPAPRRGGGAPKVTGSPVAEAVSLSKRWRIGLAAFAGLAVVGTGLHMAACFLQVAPRNAISTRLATPLNAWIYPWFEQNWSMFAPNPVSENWQILTRVANGRTGVQSDWYDISAADYANISGNPFPSHATMNELRRSWDTYSQSHDALDRPVAGIRSVLFADYLRNIAVQRTEKMTQMPFNLIQVRIVRSPVAPPGSHVIPGSIWRRLPWWPTSGDVGTPAAASGPSVANTPLTGEGPAR